MQQLKPDDYKYFSFQVWQEGIARYTEYKFLEAMAAARNTKNTLPAYRPPFRTLILLILKPI